jgi:hypothetical protein
MSAPEPVIVNALPLSVNEPAAATAPMSPSVQLGAAPVVAAAAVDDADSLLALSYARTW